MEEKGIYTLTGEGYKKIPLSIDKINYAYDLYRRNGFKDYLSVGDCMTIIMNMETSSNLKIKPLGIMPSLLFFGIPSAVLSFSIYYVMQKLHQNGTNDFINWYLSMVIPLALFLLQQ